MPSKLSIAMFGVAVAVLTAGSSIVAANNPETISELKQVAQRVLFTQFSDVPEDTEAEDEHEDKTSESESEFAQEAERDSGESEDEDEREDGDDASEHTTAVQPAATPTPTPSVATPTVASFTLAQVAAHSSAGDCYTAIAGSVYNLTPFISSHPGGVSAISALCGIDGEVLFQAQHGGMGKPEQELAGLKIGILSP